MNQENCIPTSEYHHDIPYTINRINDKRIEYAGQSLYFPPMANTPTSHPASYHYEGNPYAYPQFAQQSTGSPLMSSPVGSHPRSPSVKLQDPPMLVASSSSTTTASTMTSSSVELLNDAFAKAMSLPEAFYPEFLQYSKDSYEQSTVNKSHDKKQRKWGDEDEDDQGSEVSNKEQENKTKGKLTSTELRRQIHIQSEQKRRAQIKDGFEELRNELPTCLNKKMSKVALLHKTVQHIQHLKVTQASILSELERLVHENEQLRKFQQSVLQKQALENMYTVL